MADEPFRTGGDVIPGGADVGRDATMPAPSPAISVKRRRVTANGADSGLRSVPEETAIAFTYDRTTYAVMMATPVDLEDFAIGFSLTENIVSRPAEIADLDIIHLPLGIELRMELIGERREALAARRRRLVGPAGCGLCGIESLEAAVRKPAQLGDGLRIAPQILFRAMRELSAHQPLNVETRAAHAAGFWSLRGDRFAQVREDIGRHNALDKLAGAVARAAIDASKGFITLTSRVSIELIQKSVAMRCPVLVAVSAPTGYAIRVAEESGLTLVAVAREDAFEIFSHGERIEGA
jgi:FdhD protein